jgi:hypothetical protein
MLIGLGDDVIAVEVHVVNKRALHQEMTFHTIVSLCLVLAAGSDTIAPQVRTSAVEIVTDTISDMDHVDLVQ